MPERQETTFRLPIALRYIQEVRIYDYPGGVAASPGKYKGEFARDGQKIARDSIKTKLPFAKEIADGVIRACALYQGVREDPQFTQEEDGAVFHERRSIMFDGKFASPEQRESLKRLSVAFGVAKDLDDAERVNELIIYAAIDALPNYINLVAEYCQEFDDEILPERYIRRDCRVATIEDSILRALGLIERKVKETGGLLPFHKTNHPYGQDHLYNVWADSKTSYIHSNGELANYYQPITAIEVQGFTYDALVNAVKLFGDKYPDKAEEWRRLAKMVQTATLNRMWMEERQFFAMGLDHDPKTGQERKIDILHSNAALLLNSGIFDDLGEAGVQYIQAIVRKIFSPDFYTEVGIRCRSLEHANLVPIYDYHGSNVSWAKHSEEIASGLRRQVMLAPARVLEVGVLNGVNIEQCNSEFNYISPEGDVDYDHHEIRTPQGDVMVILGETISEGEQAWTHSAIAVIKRRIYFEKMHPELFVEDQDSWQYKLGQEALREIKAPTLIRSKEEAAGRFTESRYFKVDLEKGRALEAQFLAEKKRQLEQAVFNS